MTWRVLIAGIALGVAAVAASSIGEPSGRRINSTDRSLLIQEPEIHRPVEHDVDRHVDRDRRALRRDGQLPARELLPRRRRAVRVVRAFLAAYLSLEVGRGTAGLRRTVKETATGRLTRRLLGAPARTPAAADAPPSPGRVVGVTGEFDKPPSAFAARVLIDRGGIVTELGLVVRQEGARWLVDDLTE